MTQETKIFDRPLRTSKSLSLGKIAIYPGHESQLYMVIYSINKLIWNRNIIPWWLLLPQGVSGAIKKRGGLQPFRELGRFGAIPLGQAVITSPGKLPYRSIIHVAGINMFWRASEKSIRGSVHNAIRLVNENNWRSVAFPIIGAGSGSFRPSRALEIMIDELEKLDTPFPLEEHGSFLALNKAFTRTFHLYSYGGKGVPMPK